MQRFIFPYKAEFRSLGDDFEKRDKSKGSRITFEDVRGNQFVVSTTNLEQYNTAHMLRKGDICNLAVVVTINDDRTAYAQLHNASLIEVSGNTYEGDAL